MCGINGIYSFGPGALPVDRDELLRTRESMASRGPDAAGAWISHDQRVALASRRLAILDLSPLGEQPMGTPDGRVQIVMNGEIYNYRELRRDLEEANAVLHGRGDTAVVLGLYLRHGAAMLSRLRGMFGLAIWDSRPGSCRLLLARDPLGIKPLYYACRPPGSPRGAQQLRFASQVKALEAGGAVSSAVDPIGLAGFLLWGSVPEPRTIRADVRALPAGHFLLCADGVMQEPTPYRAAEHSNISSPEQALEESIVAHLVSDVPVAVFLSSGLDSSAIAAVAKRNLPEPPTTLTLTFDVLRGTAHDEGPLAARIAKCLGMRHVEHTLTRSDFSAMWPQVMAAMDQPSIDGFNTFAVSYAAKAAGMKVVLSGVGGDEIFGSYPSFVDVPRGVRLSRSALRIPAASFLWPPLARHLNPGRPKLAGLLRYGTSLGGSYYLRRGLFLPEELPALLGESEAHEALRAYDPVADAESRLRQSGLERGDAESDWLAVHELETSLYLRNQLLRDADWASMAWSVELRTPFVDSTLESQLRAGHFGTIRHLGKAQLVRRLAPELPAEIWTRPKTGFYFPVLEWLRPAEFGGKAPGGGLRSRALAAAVLAEFGIPLRSKSNASRAA